MASQRMNRLGSPLNSFSMTSCRQAARLHLDDCCVASEEIPCAALQDLVTFHSRDSENKIVYHTNVMMAIGTDVAVVCSESVHDDKERQHLLARLSATHSVVDITKQQMGHLCGNVLELEDGRGLPIFAMSSQVCCDLATL